MAVGLDASQYRGAVPHMVSIPYASRLDPAGVTGRRVDLALAGVT
jgi:hypothetical protein